MFRSGPCEIAGIEPTLNPTRDFGFLDFEFYFKFKTLGKFAKTNIAISLIPNDCSAFVRSPNVCSVLPCSPYVCLVFGFGAQAIGAADRIRRAVSVSVSVPVYCVAGTAAAAEVSAAAAAFLRLFAYAVALANNLILFRSRTPAGPRDSADRMNRFPLRDSTR